MLIRALSSLEESRKVAGLEQTIWDYADSEDVIPPAIVVVSLLRGGVLLGAFDDAEEMQGYAYAVPAFKEGRPTLWSHALGVVQDARGRGVGAALKVAQRQQALRMGLDLIEWTYDPLQATSAHLNFATLGIVVEEYRENLYGESSSALHRGAPTDRFVAEWHLSTPHVERRLAAAGRIGALAPSARRATPPLSARDSAVVAAVLVNPSRESSDWLQPGSSLLDAEAARVLVEIPTNFTRMVHEQPDLAREWRLATRQIFQSYFARGYRAVDFFLSRENGRGQYLLARAAG
jgi:predicted GNAT superfamily acetyltransferase